MGKLGSGGFWSKELWPPSSPNLNPLDYHVWTHVEARACAEPHPNIAALKSAVEYHWNHMSTDTLSRACAAFCGRLELCIAAQGGVVEE